MNYRYESIMTWLTYIRAGIWKIDKFDEFSEHKELIISKYEELFKYELAKECDDVYHFMINPYRRFEIPVLHINTEKYTFYVANNFYNILLFYSGIYKENDGLKLCLDTKAHGFYNSYFKYCAEEDERYVSVKSIVEGKCKGCLNVKRLISVLFARPFPCLENINPNQYYLMDYLEEEKKEMVKFGTIFINGRKKKESKKVINFE